MIYEVFAAAIKCTIFIIIIVFQQLFEREFLIQHAGTVTAIYIDNSTLIFGVLGGVLGLMALIVVIMIAITLAGIWMCNHHKRKSNKANGKGAHR